jgi:hypothetical protein
MTSSQSSSRRINRAEMNDCRNLRLIPEFPLCVESASERNRTTRASRGRFWLGVWQTVRSPGADDCRMMFTAAHRKYDLGGG